MTARPKRSARGRVLIAEDDDRTRALLVLLLEADGWEVLEAPDGQAALSLARRTSPDVVVTDLRMPGMSGIDLVQELDSLVNTRDVPKLAITSDRSRLRESAARSGRFVLVVDKPMEPTTFLEVVRSAATA